MPFGLYQAAESYGPRVIGLARLPELAPGVLLFMLSWTALTLLILAGFTWLLLKPSLSARRLSAPCPDVGC